MMYSNYDEQYVLRQKTEKDLGDAKKAKDDAQRQVTDLQTKVGLPPRKADDSAQWQQYVTDVGEHIKKYAGQKTPPTYAMAIQNLDEQLANEQTTRKKLQDNKDELEKQVKALQQEKNIAVAEADKAKLASENAKRELDTRYRGEMLKKEASLEEVAKRATEIETQREQAVRDRGLDQQRAEATIKQQETLIASQADSLKSVKATTFAQIDAVVRKVDQQGQAVYLNVGSKDYVPTRLTFAVYGLDRDGKPQLKPKAAIEVTKVIGTGQCEARITQQELMHPIQVGDVVDTPLWHPGQPQRFALVGVIDLDDNGKDDREAVRNMIKLAGATIDAEVMADGSKAGPGMTVNTNWLVLGDEPPVRAPTEATKGNVPDVQPAMAARTELSAQARQYGVHVLSVGKFKEMLGYVPRYQILRPGQGPTVRRVLTPRAPTVRSTP